MFASPTSHETASRGVRLVARLVMDERAAPSFVPEVRRSLVADDSKRSWVHLVYEGTWEGHRAGSFTFDADVFSTILANFDAQANELVFDYEHATEMMPSGEPVPAAGWVHALAVEGDSLFAYVEWTPRATELIASGEYRFCSVVVDFAATDRKSGDEIGARLCSVALTNIPFIDGQEPIRLSARPRPAGVSMSTKSTTKKISMKTPPRVALAGGAKALLQQIASLLKVNIADGEDVYWKVMDTLGVLQQAAKVEEILATTTEGPALSDRRIGLSDVIAVLAEGGAKITREQLMAALDQLEGDSFTGEQLKTLVEAIEKMAQAQDGGGSSEPTEPPAASEPPPAMSAPAGAVPPAAAPAPGDASQVAAAELMPEDAQAIGAKLGEILGLDAASLLAFLDTHRDELAGMASAQPADGTQADAGGAAMSDRSMRAVLAQLGASQRELGELRAKLKKIDDAEAERVKAEKVAAADRFVDELVQAGKIHDVAKDDFRALHLENAARAVALADKLAPVVPVGRVTPKDPKGPKGAPRVAGSGNAGDPRAALSEDEQRHFDVIAATGLYRDRAVMADKAREAAARVRSRESA